MDLILERVQNKFACIIGELCSEPIVLSKFAIWLDLRLAEYKAKGAISLDCLGENPDPIWLKGHEKPLSDCTNITRPYSTNLKQPLSHGGFSSREPFGQSEENTHPLAFETHDRLSPEILEVKKENFGNVEEVYPVSLHSVGVSEKGKNRKRTASQGSENFIDSTPSKKWQSSSLQNVTLEETNQSLMSIIGESQDNDESSVTDSTFQTSFSIPDEQASTSSILAEPRGDDSGSWSNLQASRSQGEASVSQPPGQDTGLSTQAHCNEEHLGAKSDSSRAVQVLVDLEAEEARVGRLHCVRRVKRRICDFDKKSVNTVRHISGSVGYLEWWYYKHFKDDTCIENLTPDVLDRYLTHFFSSARKPTGKDYDKLTFTTLRSYIERFLKENCYPYSITGSVEFIKSQQEFQSRRKTLM